MSIVKYKFVFVANFIGFDFAFDVFNLRFWSIVYKTTRDLFPFSDFTNGFTRETMRSRGITQFGSNPNLLKYDFRIVYTHQLTITPN